MFRLNSQFLREAGFALGAIGIWCIWSVGPLLNNEPQAFQAAGSMIVAWGIFSWGRDRMKREKSLARAELNAAVTTINTLRAQIAYHDHISHQTSNMHTLSHLQHVKASNLRDPSFPNPEEVMQILSKELADKTKNNELFLTYTQAQEAELQQFSVTKDIVSSEPRWIKLVQRCEIAFLGFGTLQWGYGDTWVMMLHGTY